MTPTRNKRSVPRSPAQLPLSELQQDRPTSPSSRSQIPSGSKRASASGDAGSTVSQPEQPYNEEAAIRTTAPAASHHRNPVVVAEGNSEPSLLTQLDVASVPFQTDFESARPAGVEGGFEGLHGGAHRPTGFRPASTSELALPTRARVGRAGGRSQSATQRPLRPHPEHSSPQNRFAASRSQLPNTKPFAGAETTAKSRASRSEDTDPEIAPERLFAQAGTPVAAEYVRRIGTEYSAWESSLDPAHVSYHSKATWPSTAAATRTPADNAGLRTSHGGADLSLWSAREGGTAMSEPPREPRLSPDNSEEQGQEGIPPGSQHASYPDLLPVQSELAHGIQQHSLAVPGQVPSRPRARPHSTPYFAAVRQGQLALDQSARHGFLGAEDVTQDDIRDQGRAPHIQPQHHAQFLQQHQQPGALPGPPGQTARWISLLGDVLEHPPDPETSPVEFPHQPIPGGIPMDPGQSHLPGEIKAEPQQGVPAGRSPHDAAGHPQTASLDFVPSELAFATAASRLHGRLRGAEQPRGVPLETHLARPAASLPPNLGESVDQPLLQLPQVLQQMAQPHTDPSQFPTDEEGQRPSKRPKSAVFTRPPDQTLAPAPGGPLSAPTFQGQRSRDRVTRGESAHTIGYGAAALAARRHEARARARERDTSAEGFAFRASEVQAVGGASGSGGESMRSAVLDADLGSIDPYDLKGHTAAEAKNMTQEERDNMLKKRKIRNRESAARTREKRKTTLQSLQAELNELTEQAESIRQRADALWRRNADLEAENLALRSRLGIPLARPGSSTTQATMPARGRSHPIVAEPGPGFRRTAVESVAPDPEARVQSVHEYQLALQRVPGAIGASAQLRSHMADRSGVVQPRARVPGRTPTAARQQEASGVSVPPRRDAEEHDEPHEGRTS